MTKFNDSRIYKSETREKMPINHGHYDTYHDVGEVHGSGSADALKTHGTDWSHMVSTLHLNVVLYQFGHNFPRLRHISVIGYEQT